MKTVLITGATSGIGHATSLRLADAGRYRLILCGRRSDRLRALETELASKCPVVTCGFDMRDREAMVTALETLPDEFAAVDVLINNAGNAHGLEPIHEGSLQDWDAMLDINVKALLAITRLVSPGMVERKSGQILNIGSIAAKESYPNGAVYCGSKAAVDAITQGMRMDLHAFGIRVGAIHPGMVETEFSLVRFKGDGDRADAVYRGLQPLTADDIARTVQWVIEQPEHVVIADLVVLPTAQASATRVQRG
ncbi:MAG: SDR family NAD(P)-dependent oxidoreductase [Puniceicoccaceae bacterium]